MKPEDAAKNIAKNVRRLRRGRGWTQTEAAGRLLVAGGPEWSKAAWSALERSADGVKVRAFTAEEVAHLAQLFEVPIAELFAAPPTETCSHCGGTGEVEAGS